MLSEKTQKSRSKLIRESLFSEVSQGREKIGETSKIAEVIKTLEEVEEIIQQKAWSASEREMVHEISTLGRETPIENEIDTVKEEMHKALSKLRKALKTLEKAVQTRGKGFGKGLIFLPVDFVPSRDFRG